MQGGEHSGHPLLPLRSSHLDDRYTLVYSSPTRYAAPHSLMSVPLGSELNGDNMSSSVYLTLPPVKVLAMS